MSKTKFASKQAKQLAEENNVSFRETFKGSSKSGAITVADVRALIEVGGAISTKPETTPEPEQKPKPKKELFALKVSRYQVKKNPSGHVEKYNVIDTLEEPTSPNRVVRDFGSEQAAKAERDRLNGLNK